MHFVINKSKRKQKMNLQFPQLDEHATQQNYTISNALLRLCTYMHFEIFILLRLDKSHLIRLSDRNDFTWEICICFYYVHCQVLYMPTKRKAQNTIMFYLAWMATWFEWPARAACNPTCWSSYKEMNVVSRLNMSGGELRKSFALLVHLLII